MKYPKCPKCGCHRLLAPARCFVEAAVEDDGTIGACKLDEPVEVALEHVQLDLKCAHCNARFAPSEARAS